jgi:hypothetical protein
MSSTRPPIVAGPIDRKTNPRSIGSVDALTGGAGAGAPPGTCARVIVPARRHAEAIGIDRRKPEEVLVIAEILSDTTCEKGELRACDEARQRLKRSLDGGWPVRGGLRRGSSGVDRFARVYTSLADP